MLNINSNKKTCYDKDSSKKSSYFSKTDKLVGSIDILI